MLLDDQTASERKPPHMNFRAFIRIMAGAMPIIKFRLYLYNALVEKMTVIEGTGMIITMLDEMKI